MTTANTNVPIDWNAVDEEVIMHLRNILRLDTRNPPGNEILAANYLRGVLEREGFECIIVGPDRERATLITRLKGDGSESPLLLMSHTDVVAVEPEKWSHDPFGAEVAEGFVYGRGALDMKNTVAMELMTMLLLKRAGVPLKRDVIFMAEADEETGGHQGAEWVVEHYPELIRAEYALNEGGGSGLEINGRLYYTVETAEKGSARFKIRATGDPGHGSMPHENNAIIKLAELLSKIRGKQPPVHFTATLRGYIEGLASAQPPRVAEALRSVLADEATASAAIDTLPIDESLKRELHAMARNTIAPTILQAGSQINVIPSEAIAYLDSRILPGQTLEGYRKELRAIFGPNCEIEFVDPSIALEADPASPLFETIKEVLSEYAPEATVVPTLLTGGTDAKHVSKLGTRVYGFSPELYSGWNGWNGVHGHDERISVRAMQWGTRVMYEVVERFVRKD
ncbi:MAG TPA: M20/M25/M40 family metallo-hydrolase [Ktedonobacteraceae bacterium]|nr:M20/M25/M40 family metallo-hydrolase [Ktedonobacteraceae bacterium]